MLAPLPGRLRVGEEVSEALTVGPASSWVIQTRLSGLPSVCIVGLSKEDMRSFFPPSEICVPTEFN